MRNRPMAAIARLCPVVVARDAELATLEALLVEVVARSGRVALLGARHSFVVPFQPRETEEA